MSLFQYPKDIHTRSQSPRQYKRYQSYKRFLQAEFSRLCVYCRQPDSSAPNLNFGADHYRPKSQFSHLYTQYNNLYYCCGQCNSRKNDYWPADIKKDCLIPNPCDHEMIKHLRFDAKSGEMKEITREGKFTIDLLQLNDDSLIRYRLAALNIVKLSNKEIKELENLIKETEKQFASGEIDANTHSEILSEANQEIFKINQIIEMQSGTLALPKYSRSRATKV